MRLGLLGGTFDPVHEGHLVLARVAVETLGLDRLLLVPCARPPHKEREDLTGPYDRFAMLALALAGEPSMAPSHAELIRGGRSFTVETLRQMEERNEGADLYLVVGSDSFIEMTTWRDYREILARAAVAVVPRPGFEPERYRERMEPALASILAAPGEPWPESLAGRLPLAGILAASPPDISSTEIRRRIREGMGIDGLVPDPVKLYIRRHGLYA